MLDSSAVLAIVNGEPGGDAAAAVLPTASLSAVNLAEVVGKLVDAEIDPRPVRNQLSAVGVTIEPLTADDGEVAGALRRLPGGRSLSLADRCCLALTVRSNPPEVVTADRAWAELDLPITIRLIR